MVDRVDPRLRDVRSHISDSVGEGEGEGDDESDKEMDDQVPETQRSNDSSAGRDESSDSMRGTILARRE